MLESNLRKCCLQSKPYLAALAIMPKPGAEEWQRGHEVYALPVTPFSQLKAEALSARLSTSTAVLNYALAFPK